MPAPVADDKSNPQLSFPWHEARRRKPNGWWAAWQRRLSITWSAIARGLDPTSGIVSMGEVRISDMILNDPRMHRLGKDPNARVLYYEAYIWSDREASEGVIDDVVLPGLCRGFESEAEAKAAALVDVGFWERRDSGYYIVGFMESGHATRADRLAFAEELKAQRSQAGKAGAAARWHPDGRGE